MSMDDNELQHRQYRVVAAAIVIAFLGLVFSVAAYNIADRLGPQRPIVTSSYQAK